MSVINFAQHFDERWIRIFDEFGIPKTVSFRPLSPNAPSAVVFCRGGNVRSAAVAFLLRYKYDVDAVALSLERNSRRAQYLFCRWADHLLIVQEKLREHLPVTEQARATLLDIGEDIYCNPMDLALLRIADAQIKACGKFPLRG